MGEALNLYWKLVRVQFRSQIQYRTSFLFLLLGTGVVTFLEFISLALVLQRFDTIQGWTVAEVAFLYGTVEIAFGLMDMTFAGFDPKDFGQRVRLGSFDQLLLRPVSVTLQVLSSDFALRRIGKIVVGIGILAYAVRELGLDLSPAGWLYLTTNILSIMLFFGALFIIGSTITFWTVESIEVMNTLTYGGSYVISHPMHIYQAWLRNFFTFILPAIFLNYYPALLLLGKTDPQPVPAWGPYMAPVVGVGALFIAMRFWRFGIRHYQSTGT